MGRIEGGPYDETPPRFISGTPTPGALHHNKNKLSIEFDEFIKLDKPNEKIVISPPQVQQPEIKSNGKKVVITLQDTLKPNTTYTFDFGDAIQIIMRGILGEFLLFFLYGRPSRLYGCGRYSTECGQS